MTPATKVPREPPTWSIQFTKPIMVPSEISPNKLDDSSVSNRSRQPKARPKIMAGTKSDHIALPLTENQSMDTSSKVVRMMVVFLMPILSAIKPSGILATVAIQEMTDKMMAAVVDEIPISMA